MKQPSKYEVEATGDVGGICDCCRHESRSVSGFVHAEEGTIAAYNIHWTIGASLADHPANIDLIIGPWGEGSSSSERFAVSLIHFENQQGPGVMLIDAIDRPIANSDLVGNALKRDELLGTPLAQQAFEIFDAVLLQDARLT